MMYLEDVSDRDLFHVVTEPEFAAVFIISEEERDGAEDNIDAQLRLPDGTCWSASFMTLDAISVVMRRWRETGECLNGAYFKVHDLVIIPEPGFDAMVRAFRGILDEGGPQGVLPQLDDPEKLDRGDTDPES